jgi:hypothetical protein
MVTIGTVTTATVTIVIAAVVFAINYNSSM